MPCAVVLLRCRVVRVEVALLHVCTVEVVVPSRGQRAQGLRVAMNGASLSDCCFQTAVCNRCLGPAQQGKKLAYKDTRF